VRITPTVEIGARLNAASTFKASYDKANWSSVESYCGPGLTEGLRILKSVRTRAPRATRRRCCSERRRGTRRCYDSFMVETPIIFPTRFKARISRHLSYAVAAELISSEFADVPQAASLDIRFFDRYQTMKTRQDPYVIFEVSYRGMREGFLAVGPGWHITVRPVPRLLKHRVKEVLVRDCFPKVRAFLRSYAGADARYGKHEIQVTFDERSESLLSSAEHHDPEALSN